LVGAPLPPPPLRPAHKMQGGVYPPPHEMQDQPGSRNSIATARWSDPAAGAVR
jgi:hypothetical protein